MRIDDTGPKAEMAGINIISNGRIGGSDVLRGDQQPIGNSKAPARDQREWRLHARCQPT